jgi:hypothetical protein
VDFCFIAKKLKFEIMHQLRIHPFELATMARMKRSGNTARHNNNSKNAELSQQKITLPTVLFFSFTFLVWMAFGKWKKFVGLLLIREIQENGFSVRMCVCVKCIRI